MALFTVLEPPHGEIDKVTFVKEGFAPAALVFTVLWALWHRLWVVAAVLFALLVAISLLAGLLGLDPAIASLLELAVGIIFGLEARRLWIMSLERSGYRLAGLIEASNREAAELAYFMKRPRAAQVETAPKFGFHTEDTLGLFGTP
jgi:hypothetical protein